MPRYSAAFDGFLEQAVGLPLWGSSRALNLQMFLLGAVVREDSGLGVVEKGEFALHVQCPWRLTGRASSIIAGSDDRRDPALKEILATRRPPRILAMKTDALGGLSVRLDGSRILQVLPCTSESGEYWRFVKLHGTHAVVTDKRAYLSKP
jgi:hypothetical protein